MTLSPRDRFNLRTVAHVVVPAALILAVLGLGYFLCDLRSLPFSVTLRLRWILLCSSVATVLITRYAGGDGGEGRAAAMGLLLMAALMATVPSIHANQPLGEVALTAGTLAVVWLFAHALTRRLRLELVEDASPAGGWRAIDQAAVERSEHAARRSRRDIAFASMLAVGVVAVGGRAIEASGRSMAFTAANDAFGMFLGLAAVAAAASSYLSLRKVAESRGAMRLGTLWFRMLVSLLLVAGSLSVGVIVFGPPAGPIGGDFAAEAQEDGASVPRGEPGEARSPRRTPGQGSQPPPAPATKVFELASAARSVAPRVLIALALIFACLFVLRRLRRMRRRETSSAAQAGSVDVFAGVGAMPATPADAAVGRAWGMARAWARQELEVPDALTPYELVERVRVLRPESQSLVAALAEAYVRASFAGEAVSDEDGVAAVEAVRALARQRSRR